MRVLFLDCFSGISGDMTVGALCDLGVKPSTFEWELSKLELGDFHMHFERRTRGSISAMKFSIHEGATHTHEQDEPAEGPSHEHEHMHAEPEHEHEHAPAEHPPGHEPGHGPATGEHHHHAEHAHGRTHAEIRALINASDLSPFVKTRSLSIFQRIAVAEGKIHGVPPAEVQFHEVGALDSIADIVCTCVGIEALDVEQVLVSRLHDGHGWIDCAHGRFPVPSAATLEILAGVPVSQIDEPHELITPTGAAIVAEFGVSFGLMPPISVAKIGYGAGSRQFHHRANVLRAVLGNVNAPGSYATDTITRLETNIDDLSAEHLGGAMDKLLSAGALDVFFTPTQMKKNRPGVQLTVLCDSEKAAQLTDILFAETTSFGIRSDEIRRLKLERRMDTVATAFGDVLVKMGLKNGKIIQASPEWESCRAVSDRSGHPVRAVYQAAAESAGKLSR